LFSIVESGSDIEGLSSATGSESDRADTGRARGLQTAEVDMLGQARDALLALVPFGCSLCLLLGGVAISQEAAFTPQKYLVVSQNGQLQVGEEVMARFSPGDVVPVTREREKWLWVELANSSGWIQKQHVLPHADALKLATKAVEGDANNAIALVTRGLVWYTNGEYDKAIEDFTAAIRIDPDLARAYSDRGNSWAAKGDRQKAITDYNTALRLLPHDALTMNNRAVARLELGDYEGAISDLTSAIRHHQAQAVTVETSAEPPSKPSAYLWVVRYFIHRGLARERTGDFQRALADYNEAIRLDPSDPAAHFNRANVWFQQLQFEQAIDGYTQVIALEGDDARAYRNRGWARFHNQQYDQAAEDSEIAIRLDSQNPIAYDASAWLRATCPVDSMRSGDKAMELATKACELTDWKNASYLATLAAGYAESGEFETAVKWQRKALSMIPEMDGAQARSRLEEYVSRRPIRHNADQ
jgi:tetratricopeptide (TPR) repeat protein